MRGSCTALLTFVVLFACSGSGLLAQTDALRVNKIDPPNWYSTLPAPMLLVQGTGLSGAQFAMDDGRLKIQRVSVSANGHWAQVFLAASPQRATTVQLGIRRGPERLSVPYTFAAPRRAGEGMAGFSAKDVLYLIMTDRFADGNLHNDGADAHSEAASPEAVAERAKPRGWHGGDLRGITEHLDYLQELGITAVWITPVYVNGEADSYHGYGATDLYGVDPHFGTLADLQTLAGALHARGMKLVLDTVPNHVGPAHPWVRDEPAPSWFHGTAARHVPAETNFRALISPHAPERDRIGTLEGWFADILPDMNTDDPAVAQYLRQNAVWWIEQTGADGLRIDTFPYVNRGFWNGFNGELKQLFPHLTEVGEVFNGAPEITSAFAGGNVRAGEDTRLYTPFDFPTFFAIRNVFGKGEPMTELTDVLAHDDLYPHPERLAPFAGNHDVPRLAEVVASPGMRELAFDFLLTTRGTPQLYAGDELAVRGGEDPDNRRDFPGGFPGAPADAFHAAGRTPEQQAMFTTMQQLLALRRAHPALACGAEQVLATGADMVVVARYGNAGCEPMPSAVSEKLIVVLERGALKVASVNLRGTALEGCEAGPMIAGEARASVREGQLTVEPRMPFTVVRCQ